MTSVLIRSVHMTSVLTKTALETEALETDVLETDVLETEGHITRQPLPDHAHPVDGNHRSSRSCQHVAGE